MSDDSSAVPQGRRHEGFCPCCRSKTVFSSEDDWLRDHYVCQRCGSIPRQRHIQLILDEQVPGWHRLALHESSPSNDFIKRWSSNYDASQYFPDVPRGEYRDGVRSEDLEALTLDDDSVDVVITQDVLEHVFHPDRVLREVHRVLRPGGAHIFTTPKHRGLTETICRAVITDDGRTEHLLEEQYHGNPIGDSKALVTFDYGQDFEDLMSTWVGTSVQAFSTVDRERGIEAQFNEVFVIRKPAISVAAHAPVATYSSRLKDARYSIRQMAKRSPLIRQAYYLGRDAKLPGRSALTRIPAAAQHPNPAMRSQSSTNSDALLAHDLVEPFASAPTMSELPRIVDVQQSAPLNPPQDIQEQFVGSSYESAFTDAATFVSVIDDWSYKHRGEGLNSAFRVIDFGAGWGRISRMLLSRVSPSTLYALDVDQRMIALIQATLPGVNALTVSPLPPTALGTGSVDALVAFSVFSHLSGHAHEAWAGEIGRLVAPGGMVAITVLDQAFFGQVAGAQHAAAEGDGGSFAEELGRTFPDLAGAIAGYDAGQIQYSGSGGGGNVLTGDYYGWAAAPPGYVQRVWGSAGFRVLEWVPAGVLFEQALVFMVRVADGSGAGPSAAVWVARRARDTVRYAKQRTTGRRPGPQGVSVE